LILSQAAYSNDSLSYTQKKYPSGTDFIRLKVPESTTKWTCFDESLYGRVIDDAYQIPIKDSLLAVCGDELTLSQGREAGYQKQFGLSKENEKNLLALEDTVFSKYTKCTENLSQEKTQKWVWGGLGSLVGAMAGAVTLLILQR